MFVKCVLFWSFLYTAGYCTISDLINDGVQAKPFTFRHSAYLGIKCYITKDKRHSNFACGSSVVNQRVLLTAAHCLNNCSTIDVSIRVGNVNVNKAKTIKYSHNKVHENYDDSSFSHDIALVVTKEDIRLGKLVTRIALLKWPPLNEAYIAGWGKTHPNKTLKANDRILRYAKQQIIDAPNCIAITKTKIPKGAMCGLAVRGNMLLGDSGSALVVHDYIQVGIASYLIPPNYSVSAYTSIPYHYDWIIQSAKETFCRG